MPHPLYPETWLDRKEAGVLLQAAGLDSHITKKTCRTRGVEMSTDGQYVRKSSLEHFIGWKVKDLQESGLLDPAPAEQVAEPARIFYTVLLDQEHFPVRFISAGKLGTFRGPFNDPGEASQEFTCCYAEGATEYINPDDFAARAAGLSEFLMPTGNAAPASQSFSLKVQENANFRAYIAELEAEDARKAAAGIPRFSAILDQIRDDGSEFSSGLGDGYMCYWDQSGPRPEASAHGVYAFMTGFSSEYSPEWIMGFVAGWFAAFGESQPQANFTWESGPAPSATAESEAR